MIDLKQFTTWDQAYKWLAKHGYGIEQIKQHQELWTSMYNKQPSLDVQEVVNTTMQSKQPSLDVQEAVKTTIKSSKPKAI